MNSLKYILLILFLFVICFIVGDVVLWFFSSKKKSLTKAITYGFAFLLAAF
jgi:hypothetical protein